MASIIIILRQVNYECSNCRAFSDMHNVYTHEAVTFIHRKVVRVLKCLSSHLEKWYVTNVFLILRKVICYKCLPLHLHLEKWCIINVFFLHSEKWCVTSVFLYTVSSIAAEPMCIKTSRKWQRRKRSCNDPLTIQQPLATLVNKFLAVLDLSLEVLELIKVTAVCDLQIL